MFTSRPEIQIEIDNLVCALSGLSVDGVLSYDDLTAMIGRDVRTVAAYSLVAARKRAEKENGALFGVVIGIGIKRLPSSAIPSVASDAIKSIGRKASRTVRRLDNISANLHPEEAAKVSAAKSMLGAIRLAANLNQSSVAKEVDKNDGKPIPVGRILEMMTRG